ncbi:Utp14-domain-containing protein [Lepidopterella palustris CBS 459.81]|uniref:Utp14-domain-containing protein n=1 Tax=Lepidopterella palustris CBS 459.81 TaxID=1314670 RepID=A0A8E2E067_9PEZI|nr:Utp14-domain-containing protein [Lepidopterella palustris CBS 459.81]
MPPRISRVSISTAKPRNARNKTKKRTIEALSIASKQIPDSLRVRRHRLGEAKQDNFKRKRQRVDEDEEDEDEESAEVRHKKIKKDRFDELDIDEGSDSEGNTWQMGQVDEDNDSDVDSDEAFGESDEERFEGFAFRGSSSEKAGKKSSRLTREVPEETSEIDLDEGVDASEEEYDDEDSLGGDAIDLATMLDQYEDDEEEAAKTAKTGKRQSNGHGREYKPSEEDDFENDEASDLSLTDADEDDDDPTKLSQLRGLIDSLQPEEELAPQGHRGLELHEGMTPSDFNVIRNQKLDIGRLSYSDPKIKKALKLLRDDIKPSKRNQISKKLEAPLPRRQQDRLDRAAANAKAKETLDRWTDTVKHNRRAEHLSFPLHDPGTAEPMGTNRLIPTSQTAPQNDLESTIQSILQESGLGGKNGKDDEEQIRAFEELQTNKLPLEEVQARRAELRKARELLMREEIRAKRIKKIKSKAYRRVHRRERERLAQREKEALAADGINVSDEEREYNDRRRAEERMGAKHRDSKWAKGVKRSGRTAWDEDAREGVTEMARRNEELRRRIEGKDIRDEDEDNSDISSEEADEDGVDDDDDPARRRLQRQLTRLSGSQSAENGTSKLESMVFMQRAEAARKARNDEDVEQMRRDLAGEESPVEEQDENATGRGRRKFGPGSKRSSDGATPSTRNEFEERHGSDDESEDGDEDGIDVTLEKPASAATTKTPPSAVTKSRRHQLIMSATDTIDPPSNPYLVKTVESKKPFKKASCRSKTRVSRNSGQNSADVQSESKKSSNRKPPAAEISRPDAGGWQTATYSNGDDGDEEAEGDHAISLPFVLRNQELTAKGFAGDDVEEQFEQEKKATTADEDDKIIDNTLPGWGNWVGEGLTKQDQNRNKGKALMKIQGIKADKRKDAKLDRVIINEKRVKKNAKFLATSLPFPFESKQQYERSLRLPKGPEWSTKQTFQDGTKPRILLKQGIIRPMEKPLV